jgi:hypothetical protein
MSVIKHQDMEVIQKVRDRAQELFTQGYNTDISEYIRQGYKIFQKDIGSFVGYTLLFFLISAVSNTIPFFGPVLVSGPLTAGYFIVARKIRKGQPYEFGTFFKGFDFFIPLLLYSLIGGILTAAGFIALVIPGIYLAVAWMFSILFIVFGEMEFWDGMEFSRKLISKKWWNFFGLVILLLLINLAGAMALLVGLIFTVPISCCAIYAAFEDIVGTE